MPRPLLKINSNPAIRNHLALIANLTTLYVLNEQDGRVPDIGAGKVLPFDALSAVMQHLNSTEPEESIELSEVEVVLMHGAYLLTSRLLVHEYGEHLLEPFLRRQAEEHPDTALSFEQLRDLLLRANAIIIKDDIQQFPQVTAIQEIGEEVMALDF